MIPIAAFGISIPLVLSVDEQADEVGAVDVFSFLHDAARAILEVVAEPMEAVHAEDAGVPVLGVGVEAVPVHMDNRAFKVGGAEDFVSVFPDPNLGGCVHALGAGKQLPESFEGEGAEVDGSFVLAAGIDVHSCVLSGTMAVVDAYQQRIFPDTTWATKASAHDKKVGRNDRWVSLRSVPAHMPVLAEQAVKQDQIV